MKKLYALMLMLATIVGVRAQGEYQTFTLGVNDVFVEYMTVPAFNGAEERSLYYISFGNLDDPKYNLPLMNVTWNHEDPSGLVAGTYTLSKGEIEEVQIGQDFEEDFKNGYNIGVDPYGVTEAWLTFEDKGSSLWQITLEAVDQYGDHYKVSLPWKEDLKNAYSKESKVQVEKDLTFTSYELIDAVLDNNVLDFAFETTPEEGQQECYVCELLYQTTAHDLPKAGTYIISDKGEMGTFRASFGGGASGPTPCFIGVWDGRTLGERWYITGGEVTINYPTEETIAIEGKVTSYYGSAFTFRYEGKNIEAGIHQITTDSASASQAYDLTGRRVSAAFKGVRVQGGRKFIVK